jgi:hypothetical protein
MAVSDWIRDVERFVRSLYLSQSFRQLELERKIVAGALVLRLVVSALFVAISIDMLVRRGASLAICFASGFALITVFFGSSLWLARARIRSLWSDLLSELLLSLDARYRREQAREPSLETVTEIGLLKWAGFRDGKSCRMSTLSTFEFPTYMESLRVTSLTLGPKGFDFEISREGAPSFEGLWVELHAANKSGAEIEGEIRAELRSIARDWERDLFVASRGSVVYLGLARVSWERATLRDLFSSFASSKACGRIVASFVGIGQIAQLARVADGPTSSKVA